MKRNLQFLPFLLSVFQKNKVLSLMFLALFSLSNSNAQVATEYTFSQLSGTYISITGGTVVASGSATDDNYFTVTLPTGFSFNGANITTIGFMSNGYLVMGNNTTHGYQPINNTASSSGVIAAFGVDLVAAGASSEMRWQEIGNEIIFQWKNFSRYLVTDNISFQVVINTATGVIKTVYNGSTTVANSSTRIPQVGLRGATNADYNARYLTNGFPDASPAWNDTAAAISNANNVRFTSGAPATYPAAGHTYVWTPTDASVDWANLQWISNTTPYTCQPVDVYTQGYEPGVTNSAGAGAGVTVQVGRFASATDVDPSTWPESAWTTATYFGESGNNDEFKLTYASLPAGSWRIATRWKINSGPYKYGATNNAFYNGTTSITGLVTVSAPPAITATATPSTPICAGTSVTLSASSAGSYTYSWDNGAGTGASVSVSPSTTTTYTVTGTDTVSGCTNTATVTVTVNPAPTAVDITTPNTSLCADAIQMLTATGGLVPVPSTVVNETFTGITAFPSGWSTNIGSGDTIAITATSSAGGSANQVVVTGNSTSAITDRVIYGPFDSTGATSVILSWKNYLEHYSATYPYSVKIQTSTNGTTWTDSSWGTANVSTSIGPGNQSTTLTTADVGSATLYISFTVTGQTFGFYNWNLDNIVVSKTVLTSQIVWTSTPASPNTMFTDAACTTAYNGTDYRTTLYVKPAATTTYTATATIGSCTKTDTVTYTVGGTTTWTGSSWDNGAPTSIMTAIIAANYSENADITACSLTVNNSAVASIPSGKNVTLSGALTVTSPATFTLYNNSNLIQGGTTNANSGSVAVKRTTNALMRQDYVMWGSPVAGQQLQAFSPATLATRFYTYDTALTTPPGGNYVATSATGNFTTGKGYLIRVPNTHPATPTTWTGTFNGVPNNGDYSITLVDGGAGQRFNAISNPYPSTIDMEDFVTANANITGTLYFWRKTNSTTNLPGYCTWAGGTFIGNGEPGGNTTTDNPNNILQVGQGFIVEANGSGTTAVFNNSMRVANNADNTFRPQSREYNRVWLNLTNPTEGFSQMAVGYITGATNGLDMFDGKHFNNGPISLTMKIGADNYVIQGKALPFADTDVVPLSYRVTNAGNYTVAIDHVDGLFTGGAQDIFIKDNLTNTYNNLNTGAYTFASDAGTFPNRFELVYRNAALNTASNSLNANQVIVYKNNGDIVINTGSISMSKVKIFDIRGRLLAEKSNVNATETKMNVGSTNEVLMVQVTSVDGVTVTKKVVN